MDGMQGMHQACLLATEAKNLGTSVPLFTLTFGTCYGHLCNDGHGLCSGLLLQARHRGQPFGDIGLSLPIQSLWTDNDDDGGGFDHKIDHKTIVQGNESPICA